MNLKFVLFIWKVLNVSSICQFHTVTFFNVSKMWVVFGSSSVVVISYANIGITHNENLKRLIFFIKAESGKMVREKIVSIDPRNLRQVHQELVDDYWRIIFYQNDMSRFRSVLEKSFERPNCSYLNNIVAIWKL